MDERRELEAWILAVGVREQGTVVIADDGELSEAVVLVEVEAGRMALEDLSQKLRRKRCQRNGKTVR